MKIIKISMCALVLGLVSFTPTANKIGMGNPVYSVAKKTAIQWKTTEVELGEIPQNKPITIEFEFANTGDSPVIISSVQASCGCTSTDYSKTPVMPGDKTKIKAVFNAATKGAFKKQITVTTNAEDAPNILMFKGTVI
jgi:hypothetical protein